MIDNSNRLEHISEYYFSKKLREVKSLIDKGEDIVNLGIGSPDLLPPENSINTVIKSLNQKNAHRYQGYSGIYQLREKISSFYKKNYEVDSILIIMYYHSLEVRRGYFTYQCLF